MCGAGLERTIERFYTDMIFSQAAVSDLKSL